MDDAVDVVGLARVPMPELADDLVAEHEALDRVLDRLGAGDEHLATPAEGWDVRDQIAHLAQGDELAALALRDPDGFQEQLVQMLADLDATLDAFEAWGRDQSLEELRARWRAARAQVVEGLSGLDVRDKVGWVVGPMGAGSFGRARLMETWAHGQDVVDAVGVERPDADRRLRHVVYLGVRTRGFSYQIRGREVPEAPVRLELAAPSGQPWAFGPEDADDRVVGAARDFALVVTQRRHPSDTRLEIVGRHAEDWMTIAQVFAGPPTDGRRPGRFPVR